MLDHAPDEPISASDKRGLPDAIHPSVPAISDPGFAQSDAELRADLAGAYALNTMRAYRADWRDWSAWCERTHNRCLPAEPRAVRDYLADLAAGKKVSTLRRRLAAVSRVHLQAGAKLDTRDPAIANFMRRIAREKGTAPAGRAEIMTDDLEAMLKGLPKNLRGLRDRAILLIGFAGGLRRSEIVDIEVNDIAWRRDGLLLTLRRSKTDQEGRGQAVGILYGRREAMCPVRALKRWIAAAEINDAGPLFRAVEAGKAIPRRLSDKMVWRLVKRCTAAAGLDPARLGAHSLRVGHVTQALANGADALKAKEQLRHRRLETTLGYNRRRSFDGNSSGKLGL